MLGYLGTRFETSEPGYCRWLKFYNSWYLKLTHCWMFIYCKGFVFALTSLWKTQIIPQILKRNEPLTFKWILLAGFPHINMDSRWVHHRSQIPWISRSLCFLPCSAMTRPKLCCILAERCGIWDRSWTTNLCLIPIFRRRIREMEERCRY